MPAASACRAGVKPRLHERFEDGARRKTDVEHGADHRFQLCRPLQDGERRKRADHPLAGRHLDRAAAGRPGAAARGALEVDAERGDLVAAEAGGVTRP
jgi:hypothetical protein